MSHPEPLVFHEPATDLTSNRHDSVKFGGPLQYIMFDHSKKEDLQGIFPKVSGTHSGPYLEKWETPSFGKLPGVPSLHCF